MKIVERCIWDRRIRNVDHSVLFLVQASREYDRCVVDAKCVLREKQVRSENREEKPGEAGVSV